MNGAEVVTLIVSGVLVGFINTLAGGGTIITVSLLIFLGLPATVANGTNRIAVVLQTLVAVVSFRKQQVLDIRRGLVLSMPAVAGSVAGSLVATNLNAQILEKVIAGAMFIILFFILFKPERWIRGRQSCSTTSIRWFEYLAYLIIGFYGGFIHIGVGFFLITGLVLMSGYDLVKANAIKNLMVLAYAPFSLAVFMIYGQVNYSYGLVLSAGNVVGALVASRFAVKQGAGFIRIVMVVVIIITILQLFGLYNFKSIFDAIL